MYICIVSLVKRKEIPRFVDVVIYIIKFKKEEKMKSYRSSYCLTSLFGSFIPTQGQHLLPRWLKQLAGI